MGKRDGLWKKLWVLALCGVMAMEPAVACAEEPAEAMNAADAQTDVSMELPEEVENDIVEIPSEAGTDPFCGSGFGRNVNWHLADGGMTISGNGAMDDFIVVYVKARAYKKDSTGKKVFGAYGKSKKIKIRK